MFIHSARANATISSSLCFHCRSHQISICRALSEWSGYIKWLRDIEQTIDKRRRFSWLTHPNNDGLYTSYRHWCRTHTTISYTNERNVKHIHIHITILCLHQCHLVQCTIVCWHTKCVTDIATCSSIVNCPWYRWSVVSYVELRTE